MKIVVRTFLFLFMSVFLLAACNNHKKENIENKEAIEHNNDSYNDGANAIEHNDSSNSEEAEVVDHGYEMAMSAYQCPMKCEGDRTYEEEGACPKCKMDLKKVEVAESTESDEKSPVQ